MAIISLKLSLHRPTNLVSKSDSTLGIMLVYIVLVLLKVAYCVSTYYGESVMG